MVMAFRATPTRVASPRLTVLVSGAGIAGLTAAYCLHRAGHSVRLIERTSDVRRFGYILDFFGPGFTVAEAIGLLPDLARIHDQIPHLRFVDARGRVRVDLSYPVLRRRVFDGRHYNFLRGDLEGVLLERVRDAVDVRFSTSIVALTERDHEVDVQLSDGAMARWFAPSSAIRLAVRNVGLRVASWPGGWRIARRAANVRRDPPASIPRSA
jgi:2-polyprenyl-6-methoxyphenol hydroxylase-like FAD-dependent oxidoreductase